MIKLILLFKECGCHWWLYDAQILSRSSKKRSTWTVNDLLVTTMVKLPVKQKVSSNRKHRLKEIHTPHAEWRLLNGLLCVSQNKPLCISRWHCWNGQHFYHLVIFFSTCSDINQSNNLKGRNSQFKTQFLNFY